MTVLPYSNEQFFRQSQLTRAAIRCRNYIGGASPNRAVEPIEIAALETDHTRWLLPPTRFAGVSDAEQLSEIVAQRIPNMSETLDFQAEVCGIFEELIINAIQHSLSDRSGRGNSAAEQRRNRTYAMVEYSENGPNHLFSVGVRDTGGGIRATLRNAPRFPYKEPLDDIGAISYATELGTTATQDQRGIGLYHVKEVASAYGGCLLITSSTGLFLSVKGLLEEVVTKWAPIHGTLSFAALFAPRVI